MSYPLSREVSVGDATEAAQYNNLRTDALYMGKDPGSAGTVRDLICSLTENPGLERYNQTTIRLKASEDEPAAVTIGGAVYAVTGDISLTVSDQTLNGPGRYKIYAVTGSGGSFTLEAGTSAPGNGKEIGCFIWSGSGIIPGTVRSKRDQEIIQNGKNLQPANGRLTLASGTPVTDTDITNSERVYYTPYKGNEIGLYLGGQWELFSFTEMSLSLSGRQQNIPYDVFIGANANGLYLTAEAWGSASGRLTSLSYQDGVPVSTSDPGLRYLGTIALNSSGYGEDSKTGRLLYNEYNRAARPLISKLETEKIPVYHASKWAPYFDEDAPEVRILVPNADTEFELEGTGISGYIDEANAAAYRTGIIGISRDMEKDDPYTGNTSIVPVFAYNYGNSPMTVKIFNSGSEFRGTHTYTLSFFTNYQYAPGAVAFTAIGAGAGLYGRIMG